MPFAQDFYLCCKAATAKGQDANRNFDLYFHNIMPLILVLIAPDDKREIRNPYVIVLRIKQESSCNFAVECLIPCLRVIVADILATHEILI